MATTDVPACPMDATRDDRTSAALAEGRVHANAGARLVHVQANGGGKIDELSYQLACAVAAEIVGLTNSNRAGLAKRIQGTLLGLRVREFNPALRSGAQFLTISHLIEEGYPNRPILIECMTYEVAGMVTMREFIVMAAWHMFDDAALRDRFSSSDEAGQTAILEEILRLEPVAAMLHRKAATAATAAPGPRSPSPRPGSSWAG